MSECAPGCGRCCDPVVLDFPISDMHGPSGPFARAHWTEIGTGVDDRPGAGGKTLHLVECDAFDRHTRLCTAGDERPPICSGFPYYADLPERLHSTHSLPPGCAYLADHYRLLPIVEVT